MDNSMGSPRSPGNFEGTESLQKMRGQVQEAYAQWRMSSSHHASKYRNTLPLQLCWDDPLVEGILDSRLINYFIRKPKELAAAPIEVRSMYEPYMYRCEQALVEVVARRSYNSGRYWIAKGKWKDRLDGSDADGPVPLVGGVLGVPVAPPMLRNLVVQGLEHDNRWTEYDSSIQRMGLLTNAEAEALGDETNKAYLLSDEALTVFKPGNGLEYTGTMTRPHIKETSIQRFHIPQSVSVPQGQIDPTHVFVSGITIWRWPTGRIKIYREMERHVPDDALSGPYHPVWSECAPININPKFLRRFSDLTAGELMTFLTGFYRKLEFMGRLGDQGRWTDLQVATYMSCARDATQEWAVKRTTLSKMKPLRANEILGIAEIDKWASKRVPIEDSIPIDYYVWDMAAGVVHDPKDVSMNEREWTRGNDRWPLAQERSSLTRVLETLDELPGYRSVVKLSNVGLFMSAIGMYLDPPLLVDPSRNYDRESRDRHAEALWLWKRDNMPNDTQKKG